MIDGWTSYIAVSMLGYGEKHPLPRLIMESCGIGYPILKLGMILAIIYLLDVVFREELKDKPLLTNLIKIFIFALGFSPGVRDLLRVVMGV
jgi:uncharacterized membrane protein